MQRILVTLLVLVIPTMCIYAQDTSSTITHKPKKPLSKNYIGIGTGINSNVGIIGATYEHIFKDQIGTYVNVGAGSWGTKMGLGVRMYFSNALGGAFSINYSHVTGAPETSAMLNTTAPNGGVVTKEKVVFEAKPVNVLNASYLYFWPLAKKSRFNIEVGYSVPLDGKSEDNYIIKTPNITLTEESKNALNLVQPGGLMIAIGFTFGL